MALKQTDGGVTRCSGVHTAVCYQEGRERIGTIYLIHPSVTSAKLEGVLLFFLGF